MADLVSVLRSWAVRDDLYRRRRRHGSTHPLSDAEVAAIRSCRERELSGLPPKERMAGRIALGRWAPPTVGR